MSNPCVLVVVMALATSPLALAQQALPAGPFGIQNLTYSGSGCPAGTADWMLSIDGQVFNVTFWDFLAHACPSCSAADSQKRCDLTFDLLVPPGYTFAVASVNTLGYVDLDAKNIAELYVALDHEGLTKQNKHGKLQHAQKHKYRQSGLTDIFETDLVKDQAKIWSYCGKTTRVTLSTSILADAKLGGEAVIGLDNQDGTLPATPANTIEFAWKKCPAGQVR